MNEASACEIIVNQYPIQCGLGRCDPLICNGREPAEWYCGCPTCHEQGWHTIVAGEKTCGQHVLFLQSAQGGNMTQLEACVTIAREFPIHCGPTCDPNACHNENPQYCGCTECVQVWDDAAGQYTCGERIQSLVLTEESTVNDACTTVANEFPVECRACHPTKCDNQAPPLCGCTSCTQEIWNRPADEFTCGGRIQTLIMKENYEEVDACRETVNEYPFACRECHPEKCDDQAPAACGCESCTEDVWNEEAGEYTCGARVQYLQSEDGGTMAEEDSCRKIAYDYPFRCSACDPDTCIETTETTPILCGCQECVEKVWNRKAGNFSCGERIRFLQSTEGGGLVELEACTNVGELWPEECGQCNPDLCDGRGPTFCGCHDCEEKWGTSVLGYTCGERIQSFRFSNITLMEACAYVSDEFPGKFAESLRGTNNYSFASQFITNQRALWSFMPSRYDIYKIQRLSRRTASNIVSMSRQENAMVSVWPFQ